METRPIGKAPLDDVEGIPIVIRAHQEEPGLFEATATIVFAMLKSGSLGSHEVLAAIPMVRAALTRTPAQWDEFLETELKRLEARDKDG